MCNCVKNPTSAFPKNIVEKFIDSTNKAGEAVKKIWESTAPSGERVHKIKRK